MTKHTRFRILEALVVGVLALLVLVVAQAFREARADELETTWRAGDETVERIGCKAPRDVEQLMRAGGLLERALMWAAIDGRCFVLSRKIGVVLRRWVSGPHSAGGPPVSVWEVEDPALRRRFWSWYADGAGPHQRPEAM